MDDDELLPAVVIDNGSGSIKAGWGGDDGPQFYFPNLVGKSGDTERVVPSDSFVNIYQSVRELQSLRYPISHGIVQNWDDMETVWNYTFEKLAVDSSERPVYMTDAVLNPKSNREKMTQSMFERFDVPLLYIARQPHMVFVSYGQTTGMAVEIGDGVLQTFPVCEANSSGNAWMRQDIAGSDYTDYLAKLLNEKGYSFSTVAEKQIVRDIKEKHCRVALDYEAELAAYQQDCTADMKATYQLPDGSEVSLDKECIQVAEALFRPSLLGKDGLGIHEMTYQAIMNCDIDQRANMYCNVLMAGGSTLFPGFKERMQKEMELLAPKHMKLKIICGVERNFSSWIGCSIYASLSLMNNIWITKQEYEEYGPSIVHKV